MIGGESADSGQPSFRITSKPIADAITYVKLSGTIDASFNPAAISTAAYGKILVVDLGNVKRISSSGLKGWTELVMTHEPTFLVEVSAHVISQFNMMTGLAGKSKIVSFYAPYLCTACNAEFDVLFLLPRDHLVVRDLAPPQNPCTRCGAPCNLDDEPATFFAMLMTQSVFELGEEMLAFLRSQLKYEIIEDATALRVDRYSTKAYSYLKISGNINRAFPAETVAAGVSATPVVDLQSSRLVDSGGVTRLRALLRAMVEKFPLVSIYDCPSTVLERVILPEDLQSRIQINTLLIKYDCSQCLDSVNQRVDVAEHHSTLRTAIPPPIMCQRCAIAMVADVSESLSTMLRRLPKPSQPSGLGSFARKARSLPQRKLENGLATKQAAKSPVTTLLYLSIGLAVAILGFVVWSEFWDRPAKHVVATQPATQQPTTRQFQRPAWIIADAQLTGYCHDLVTRFMCVGISSYKPSRDEALADANNAALDELANAIALKITEPGFRAITQGYETSRTRALAALDADDTSANKGRALRVVADARGRVTAMLRKQGGTAVPAQRSDWYWEEYRGDKGMAEFLVFVRYDISLDAVKSLVGTYGTPATVAGAKVFTAFPSLAWALPDLGSGVVIAEPGQLAAAGIEKGDVITAIGEQPVRDAVDFVARADQRKDTHLKLAVQTPGKSPRVVEW